MMEKRTRGRFSYREDRKLIQMVAGSATLDEAAVTLRTSVETIERGAKRLGLLLVEPDGQKRVVGSSRIGPQGMTDARSAGPWTPEEDGLLRSMAAAGESVAAITKPLKRTAGSVRKRIRILKSSWPLSRQGRRQRRRRGNDSTWLKTANGGHLGKMPCFEGW